MKQIYVILTLLLLVILPSKSQEIKHKTYRATYYHDKFENRRTSSGERFSQRNYTAAHKTIKLGTLVLVTDSIANRWVIVKVNDRCPKKNILDLSKKAFRRLNLSSRRGQKYVNVIEIPDIFIPIWQSQDSMQNTLDNPILETILNPLKHSEFTNQTQTTEQISKQTPKTSTKAKSTKHKSKKKHKKRRKR